MTITAGDGTEIPLRLFEAVGRPSAVLIVFPAMGVPAAKYETFALGLSELAFHVVAAELRGVGESPVRASRSVDFGYDDLLQNDWPAVIHETADRWPGLPVVLIGHSLGGQLSLLYSAAHPDEVAALVLPATSTIHWRGFPFPSVFTILASSQAARLIASALGKVPRGLFGLGAPQARTLIRDWAHAGLTGRWQPRGSTLDYRRLLAELSVPTLSITVEGDSYAPPKAAARLIRSLQNTTSIHMSAADLGGTESSHVGWLKEPGPVAVQIADWLRETLPR